MTSITDLPREIILKIFQLYLETEDQSSLMEIIYNVCLDWKNLCFDSSLWIYFDGTVSFRTVMELCNQKSLIRTKQFTFCRVKSDKVITDEKLKKLFSELKKVNGINFTHLGKITSNILPALESNCPYLNSIQFWKYRDSLQTTVFYDSLVAFLSVRGSNLLSINLSYCKLNRPRIALRCIADNCYNLEQLSLIHMVVAPTTVFPTKYFQEKCPKIKELHLDFTLNINKEKHEVGFPNLEIFSFGDPWGTAINDNGLNCIVFNSLNLKFLDLTNTSISADILCSLPASNLQSLHVGRSKICNSKKLSEVLSKWYSSLKQVDISYSSGSSINRTVIDLVCTPAESQIEDLNLSYTQITADVVERILYSCKKLHQLRLESCRSLGRGMKKVYYGKSELNMLSKSLKSFIYKD